MIQLDTVAFGRAADWERLPRIVAEQSFDQTVTNEEFPGAILPRLRPNADVVWYAVASSARDWRRLRPLLLAYAGPTVTTFRGVQSDLDPADPVEGLLLQSGVRYAARLGAGPNNLKFAAQALARLISALASVPRDAQGPQRSTGSLLAELEMCLAAGEKLGAERVLGVLRDEWRLDALNIRFVEIRIAATFREWPQLAAQPWFDDICRVPKPKSIAYALLQAIWYSYLAPYGEDQEAASQACDDNLRALGLDLLREAGYPSDEVGSSVSAIIGGSTTASEIADGADDVSIVAEQESVSEANWSDDAPAKIGWAAWLDALSKDQIRNFADTAREAAYALPAAEVCEPAQVEAIAEPFAELALDVRYRTPLLVAAPELVRWFKADPEFPRLLMKPIYVAALTVFTIFDEKSAATRDAMLDTLDALLALGPDAREYGEHLQDASKFVEGEAGASTIYWHLELAERLTWHPAPDGEARLRLLSDILASLRPVTGLLTAGQRIAYRRVASLTGWPSLPEPVEGEAADGTSTALNGKVVAIYTLTESAGKQARDALKELLPGATLKVNADHVCTESLKSLAQGVDLFVIATGSAKHAATDCIQRHRSSAVRVAYARGKGYSSIIRAVEEMLPYFAS